MPVARGFGKLLDAMERDMEARYLVEVVQHEVRVAEISRDFAAALGLSAAEQKVCHLAGRFHDVGKLQVPIGILLKPDRLTHDEQTAMQAHTVHGVGILSACRAAVPSRIRDAVRYHHERWDGTGYEGVTGSGIPFIARMIALADVHDALMSDRVYRSGMSEAAALGIMVDTERKDAAFFDPDLLRSFVGWRIAVSPTLDPSSKRLLGVFASSSAPDPERVPDPIVLRHPPAVVTGDPLPPAL